MIKMIYIFEFLFVSVTLGYFIFKDVTKFNSLEKEEKTNITIPLLMQGVFWKVVLILLSFIFLIKQRSLIYFLFYNLIPDLYNSILKIFS